MLDDTDIDYQALCIFQFTITRRIIFINDS